MGGCSSKAQASEPDAAGTVGLKDVNLANQPPLTKEDSSSTFYSARASALEGNDPPTEEDLAGEGVADMNSFTNKWTVNEPAIVRILSDPKVGSEEQRASVALMLGAADTVTQRWHLVAKKVITQNKAKQVAAALAAGGSPSPAIDTAVEAKPAYNPNFVGKWEQESMEADKLDKILKVRRARTAPARACVLVRVVREALCVRR